MKVGCRLPGGITIETGTPGKEDYAYYHVPGRVKRGRGFAAGTAMAPDNVATAWFKRNAALRIVRDGDVFQVKPGQDV